MIGGIFYACATKFSRANFILAVSKTESLLDFYIFNLLLFAFVLQVAIEASCLGSHHAHTASTLKRAALDELRNCTRRAVSRQFKAPRLTLRGWMDDEEAIRTFQGSERKKAMKLGGPESLPFAHYLLLFMKDQRCNEKVCSAVGSLKFMITGSVVAWRVLCVDT